jgi:hypothetical protein
MVTANALSVARMSFFIQEVARQKKRFSHHDIAADSSYLRHPSFMSAHILPKDFVGYVEETLRLMEAEGFKPIEKEGMERLIAWMRQPDPPKETLERDRADFFRMFNEYDRRRGTDFEKTFPEYREFWRHCANLAAGSSL